MTKNILKCGLLWSVLLLSACDKFIEVQPKGYRIPSNYSDFDLLLNNGTLTAISNSNIVYLSDDIDIVADDLQGTDVATLTYLWAEQPVLTINDDPPYWSEGYRNIYYYNAVINGIPADVADSFGKQLRAEALFGRALEYFYLVNLYAAEYTKSTAAQMPGVPFVTSNSLEDKTPPRGTVQAVYDQLLSDVNAALPYLPDDNKKNRYRPDKKSGYGLLARLYLHMDEYDKAAEQALKATEGLSVLDMRTMPAVLTSAQAYRADNTVSCILARYPAGIYLNEYPVNDDLFALYQSGDLRLRYVYSQTTPSTGRGSVTSMQYFFSKNIGISVEEMKLILAEVAARSGELSKALDLINGIRQNRIPAASYSPLVSQDKDVVLAYVFQERRREFSFTGMRWFDMRRLNAEGKMPAVKRLAEAGNTLSELGPNSPKYVMQIPIKVSFFNPDMQLNPR